ncbi:4Fe-4S binding protein [bacterium]|nr:4Fe-4S binding protein [bacterium]
MLKDLLETKHCFKLICGAGNEDIEEVRRLVYLYALAGCRFFDLSANIAIIDSAKEVLEQAHALDSYICVSVGIKNDPHSNKAIIDYDKCINCGSCEAICPQKAIHYAKINKTKCIGCARCEKVCPKNAISYISEEKKLDEVLPPIIKRGIDCIEFHVIGQDENEIFSKWHYINEIYDGDLSICISRAKLGDEALINTLKKMIEGRKPFSTIIQADGFPMSGGDDNYKSTLQTVAIAEIIQNAKLPVHLILSGGTNGKTSELAHICEINYNAVAIGSYARKIVRKYIERPDFWTNDNVIQNALEVAKPLVDTVIL